MKSQRYLSSLTEEAVWKDLEILDNDLAPLWVIGKKSYQRYKITAAPPHFSIAKAVRNKGGILYPVKAEGTIERINGQTQVNFNFGITTDGYLIAGILVLAMIFGSIMIPLAMNNTESYPMGRFTIVFFLFPLFFFPIYFFVLPYRHLNELLQTRWKLIKNSEQKEI